MSVDHVDHECLVPLQTFHTEHALKPVPEFTSSFLMSCFFFLIQYCIWYKSFLFHS